MVKEVKQPFHRVLKPDSFPKRFNTHKYWGKKPSNVVDEYIEYYTKPGDTVLDPFSGSGVVFTESALLNRKAIAYDINPIAKMLSTSLLSGVDPETFLEAYTKLLENVSNFLDPLYKTHDEEGELRKVVAWLWNDDELVGVRYLNNRGKAVDKLPDEEDLLLEKQSHDLNIEHWIPEDLIFDGWQTKKLKRRGFVKYSDLFTHRNLWALSIIFSEITKIKDENVKQLMTVAFTGSVAQGSKLMTNYGKSAGPSWKINTFWIAPNRMELNVLHYFSNRFKKVLSGLEEVTSKGKLKYEPKFFEKSSSNMSDLESNSVDYIFTDPPYGGEGIQYMELSYLWNVWLKYFGESIRWRDEIAYNEYREEKKDADSYEQGLGQVFAESFRVLKPGAWISITFANKDIKTWTSLMRVLNQNGFVLKNIIPMKPSAPSITQLNMKDASKSDLILNLQKPSGNSGTQEQMDLSLFDFSESVARAVKSIKADNGIITIGHVFDFVTIDWMTDMFSNIDLSVSVPMFTKDEIRTVLEEQLNLTETEETFAGDAVWE